MTLHELEQLYSNEIFNQAPMVLSLEDKWLEVWYSQFDYHHDIQHPYYRR